MAPDAGRARKPRENQFLFDLGVKGRKTGLTLPDTGIRDENGLEPMDHLFSSPEKPASKRRENGVHRNVNATISSEEDMDMGESTVPEPTAVLNARQSARMPPPRSKSPMKTYLQSPARRNHSLGPVSSPLRGSVVAPKTVTAGPSVRRKLDFSTDDIDASVIESPEKEPRTQRREGPAKDPWAQKREAQRNFRNGTHPTLKPSALSYDGADEDEDAEDNTRLDNEEDSFQMINGGDDEEQEEPEPESEVEKPNKVRSRPKGKGKEKAIEHELDSELDVEPEVGQEPVKASKKGKAKARKEPPTEAEEPPARRPRRSIDKAGPASKAVPKSKTIKPAAKPKAPVKKSRLAPIAEAGSPNIRHAPPLPKNNRGLFIMRRETPMVGPSFVQSRYGRNSIKPLAYWKNETVEYSAEEADDGGNAFLLHKIKEVVRKDEVENPRAKRSTNRQGKGKGKKRAVEQELVEETDPWEADPGLVYNYIRQWDPIDPVGTEAPEEEQEVAWSSAAIVTKDVAGANFGFAKCLTMPFFGAGMVDFPVGAVKKPKNTRKMQMVFFVYTGRVQVTVNGGDPFRISKGGMWQVPRGNFYSIDNDGDKAARVFFAQGCEIEEMSAEGGA